MRQDRDRGRKEGAEQCWTLVSAVGVLGLHAEQRCISGARKRPTKLGAQARALRSENRRRRRDPKFIFAHVLDRSAQPASSEPYRACLCFSSLRV